jgi:Ca2+-binding RTX toxin-like protein
MATYSLTQQDHENLEAWLKSFNSAIDDEIFTLEALAQRPASVDMVAALNEAIQKLSRINVFVAGYITHVRINGSNEGYTQEFITLKTSLSTGIAAALTIGGGLAIAASPGFGPYAPFVALAGFTAVWFAGEAGEAVEDLLDLLAEYAIAEFGPIAQDLLLQAEYIWGTEDGNVLIAMNPDIIQHLHGIDGENTLIGSAGRNFFYGGPQGDTIITGGGDNVVFGDLMPNFSQLHLMRGGNNVITTGDGDNQIFTYSGNNTITLGDGDNVVYSGLGSDHIHVGGGNNIIDAEAIWVGQVHHTAGASRDTNIVDYSALNRSLVVLASVNEPVTGRRSFTVDKIDPDGEAGTTSDYLQGIQEIRFAFHPSTMMLSGVLGARHPWRFSPMSGHRARSTRSISAR